MIIETQITEDGQEAFNIKTDTVVQLNEQSDAEIIILRMKESDQTLPSEILAQIANIDARKMSEASFQSEMDDATLVLASLADACVAHEFTSNAPTILTQKSEANGKTYSSLCINKNGMNDEEVANWIEQNGDLSDAQREAFLQQQGSKRITSWHYKSELDGAAK